MHDDNLCWIVHAHMKDLTPYFKVTGEFENYSEWYSGPTDQLFWSYLLLFQSEWLFGWQLVDTSVLIHVDLLFFPTY